MACYVHSYASVKPYMGSFCVGLCVRVLFISPHSPCFKVKRIEREAQAKVREERRLAMEQERERKRQEK